VNALEAREGKGSIVLLDEVEKAHSDILTVLLQVFDEGRITNSKGRTIDCRQSIFIMTSNVGAEEIASLGGQLRAASNLPAPGQVIPESVIVAAPSLLTAEEELVRAVEPRLKEQFKRDEFIGRISEIVPFLPFDDEELRAIAGLILRKWAKIGVEQHCIRLEWDVTVVNALAKEYNPKYGVRSLRNLFEKKVLSQLADWTMRGAIQPGDIVRLHMKPGASEISPLVTGRDPSLVRSPPGPPPADSAAGPAIKA
jgi:ATP-dependent Clp protease ATP-binding subunit ClpB